jgi:hypothetical protein
LLDRVWKEAAALDAESSRRLVAFWLASSAVCSKQSCSSLPGSALLNVLGLIDSKVLDEMGRELFDGFPYRGASSARSDVLCPV